MYLHLQSLFPKYLENLEPIPSLDSGHNVSDKKSYTEVHTSDNHQVHHQIFTCTFYIKIVSCRPGHNWVMNLVIV